MDFVVRSVARVLSSRREVLDDQWSSESSFIVFNDEVPLEALVGLSDFSHVEVVAFADQASDVPPAPWRRRPRGNPAWPEVGIFAQRNKDRPNRLLVSVARVISLTGRRLELDGLDLVDGTPILDVKPVFSWSGLRGERRVAPWSDEIGRGYF